MTEAEYRDKMREALVEGLLSCNGAACNEETKRATDLLRQQGWEEVQDAPQNAGD